MAEEQPDRDQPSLELPSLFKRGGKPETRHIEPVEARELAPQEPPVETSGPRVPPLLAAAITGALVGLVTVGLVWLALRGCSGLRGTASCGDPASWCCSRSSWRWCSPGVRCWPGCGCPTPAAPRCSAWRCSRWSPCCSSTTSTSALGAAVLAVVGALAFALSQWVTSTFTEPGDRPR